MREKIGREMGPIEARGKERETMSRLKGFLEGRFLVGLRGYGGYGGTIPAFTVNIGQ